MARQSPGRRNAEERAVGRDADPDVSNDANEEANEEVDELEESDETIAVTASDRPIWAEVRIDPIEIALPAGTGYTLRAYRPSRGLTPTVVEDREEDDLFVRRPSVPTEDEEVVILDEDFNEDIVEDEEGNEEDHDEGETEPEEDDEETATEDEEVPVFLSHRGKLLLFRSTESLVEFVRSGEPHDLAQLDTWPELVERIEPADVVPRDEDTYELDLVVENLRGGNDTWDVGLLISAGEIARDLAYALRLEPLITALAPGSPLDDLDEALRKTNAGGLGGLIGRRRLRKIGAQQATLGWRTIIGKISAVVYWRD